MTTSGSFGTIFKDCMKDMYPRVDLRKYFVFTKKMVDNHDYYYSESVAIEDNQDFQKIRRVFNSVSRHLGCEKLL